MVSSEAGALIASSHCHKSAPEVWQRKAGNGNVTAGTSRAGSRWAGDEHHRATACQRGRSCLFPGGF